MSLSKHWNDKVQLFLPLEEIESSAIEQINNIADLDIVQKIAIMPDCHFGKGATVGSVIASRFAIIPAAVGVDIGCGMAALKTNLNASRLPESLATIRLAIESVVPVGFNEHNTRDVLKGINLNLKEAHKKIGLSFNSLNAKVRDDKFRSQIGTLGGGNHFIELCLDQDNNVWLMLHSGSRNVGNEIAKVHITKAYQIIEKQGIKLVDKECAWLEDHTAEFKAYYDDVQWAQEYARINRLTMLHNIWQVLSTYFPDINIVNEAIHCHHNYISREIFDSFSYYITRKGAVNAELGKLGIIPGSMGTKSYIVKGKGNPQSLNSCSHGAGRRMSRGQAKRQFTLDDLQEQTKGVECRKDLGVLDEIPGAYKDVDKVMEHQRDLVEVVAVLKAVMCVKG